MKEKNIFNHVAFGKALDESDYKVAEIARMVGCKRSDLYRYKNGEVTPRLGRLKKLMEILGPSISNFSFKTNGGSAWNFSVEERRYTQWFESLPPFRQARMLGYTQAIFEFGSEADAKFAADFAEQLILSKQQHIEQKV